MEQVLPRRSLSLFLSFLSLFSVFRVESEGGAGGLVSFTGEGDDDDDTLQMTLVERQEMCQ